MVYRHYPQHASVIQDRVSASTRTALGSGGHEYPKASHFYQTGEHPSSKAETERMSRDTVRQDIYAFSADRLIEFPGIETIPMRVTAALPPLRT